MSQNDSTREVACSLTEEDETERSANVRSLLIDHFLGHEEREGGIDVRFEGTDASLRALALFTSDELLCCSFAEYEITVSPPYEETMLSITGPDGTKQMFREGLIERLETDSV